MKTFDLTGNYEVLDENFVHLETTGGTVLLNAKEQGFENTKELINKYLADGKISIRNVPVDNSSVDSE